MLNSGYNFVKKKWTKADGLAKFRGDKNVAALKVSFFGPFYSGYKVGDIIFNGFIGPTVLQQSAAHEELY